jgi:hypothetical protein
MKRVFGSLVCALLLAVPMALAGQEKKAEGKTLNADGKVTAVTNTSLTVKGKDAEWTFAVDKDTKFTGKGMSTTSAANKAEGKGTVPTDVVHVGDEVSVAYHDMGATKHAASVRVVIPVPAPPKKN